jgi:hypothetical protein
LSSLAFANAPRLGETFAIGIETEAVATKGRTKATILTVVICRLRRSFLRVLFREDHKADATA